MGVVEVEALDHWESMTAYSLHLEKKHNELLESLFEAGIYRKLYSYRHLIDGFAIHVSPEQAETLSRAPVVKYIEKDTKVKKLTTHTPQFPGLTAGVWLTRGGYDKAGEDIVIGLMDSGIYPHHPSFSAYYSKTYERVPHYKGKLPGYQKQKQYPQRACDRIGGLIPIGTIYLMILIQQQP